MDQFTYGQDERRGTGRGDRVQRLAEAFVGYLRSRTAEHWIMFVAGLALGVLLG
jgi:hypothetical protein